MIQKHINILILFLLLLSCAELEKADGWSNPLDPNGDNYHPPILKAMKDSSIIVNDTVALYVDVIDSNGEVESILWSFDNGNNWSDTVYGNANLKKVFNSKNAGVQNILVYAIDNDGLNSKVDTVKITVDLAPPTITSNEDLLVSQDSTVSISVTAKDENVNGIIEKYYLDVGLNGWDDSSSNNIFDLSKSSGGFENYRLGARDDDSNMVYDTFAIRFNRPPASLSIDNFQSGDTIYYKNVNLLDLNGTVNLSINAIDPDSSMDELEYCLYIWKENENPEKVYQDKSSNILLKNLDMAEKYNFKLIVRDEYGDSITEEGYFYTEVIDLVNPEITLFGDNPLNIPKGFSYKEQGYKGLDEIDGDITDSIKISGDEVNTDVLGTYNVIYSLKDKAGNDTSIIRTVNVNNYISVENFNGGESYQTTFGALFDDKDSTGYWKAWSDTYSGGNTAMRPEINLGTDSAFKHNHVKNVGIDGGNAFNVNVSIGEEAYYPYWGVGFFLKNRGDYYDLSGLDSLVFYVKGSIASDSGSYRIQFTYEELDTLWEDSKWGYAGMELSLTTDWKKIVITPSDIIGVSASPGDGHNWDRIKHGINMIQFCEQPGKSEIPDIKLFIDDIRMYGDFSGTVLFE